MPRVPRIIALNQPFHVVNRGNNRQTLFAEASDFVHYLHLLRRYKQKLRILIHHYVLMPNHVHLVVQSTRRLQDLSNFMQRTSLSYTRTINNRLDRSGHLWQGRFYSSAITDDAYFLQCAMYVESNPVRAGLAQRAEDYQWSSFQAHGLGRRDLLVDTHPLIASLGQDGVSRRQTYMRLMAQHVAEWRVKSADLTP